MVKNYIPERADIVWLNFTPQSGHEQRGRRPALVLSPKEYNSKVGLAIFCPITSNIKGYPFEVIIPDNIEIKGVVLSDQIRNLDWISRQAEFICKLNTNKFLEVQQKILLLLK